MEPRLATSPARVVKTGVPSAGQMGLLPRPRALLCDLDGTLIDTMPTLADLATDVLSEVHGMARPLARELYIATCGLPFIQQLDHIAPGDPRNGYASDLFEGRKPARCRSVRMPSDTRRALTDLRARGVKIVVSSNNGQVNVDAFVEDSGFPFDLVLGYGGGMAKGRTHVDRTLRTFGLSREDLLFVGDSLHDGEIAETERLAFVGLAGTFSRERFMLRFPHHAVVNRFSELTGLLS